MLLIPCPYCGMERPELEFRNGGEAHIARPARPGRGQRRGLGRSTSISAPTRRACSPSAGATSSGCGRFFNCLRDTVSDRILAVYKAGEPRPDLGGEDRVMTQAFRVAGGASLDRARPVSFTFDGVAYGGYEGDTLASALLANGVRLVGRSYKYHRPRGIVSAGAEEPNALVGVSRGPGRFTPNLRATQVELYDGLVATSQNRWPSLRFDVGAINDVLAPLYRRGLLLQDLHGPGLFGTNWAWKRIYEPVIRRAAGLGDRADGARPGPLCPLFRPLRRADRRRRARGPRRGARRGRERRRRRRLRREPGARRLAPRRDARAIDGKQRARLARRDARRARAAPNVRLMPRTQAFGYYAQNFVASSERLAEPDLDRRSRSAARAAVADAGARGRAGDRRHRAPARLRRQRPAGDHARRRGAALSQPLRRQGRRARRRRHRA